MNLMIQSESSIWSKVQPYDTASTRCMIPACSTTSELRGYETFSDWKVRWILKPGRGWLMLMSGTTLEPGGLYVACTGLTISFSCHVDISSVSPRGVVPIVRNVRSKRCVLDANCEPTPELRWRVKLLVTHIASIVAWMRPARSVRNSAATATTRNPHIARLLP